MNRNSFYFLILLFCIISCQKDRSDKPSGYWKVGNIHNGNSVSYADTQKVYVPTATIITGSTFKAVWKGGFSDENSITYFFPGSVSPSIGTYKLVAGMPSSGEVSFYITDSRSFNGNLRPLSVYESVVTVTNVNNKLRIEMPPVWAKIDKDRNDSTLVTADLTEE